MANKKASKKDILVSARNKARNIAFRSRMKSSLKKATSAIAANSSDKETIVRQTIRIIDKTVSKGVIKKQTAARKKSRLVLALNKTNLE